MKNKIIKIKGMHCKSCEALIQDSLEEAEGVISTDISLTKGTAKVEYDEKRIDEEKIKAIIESEGYKVI